MIRLGGQLDIGSEKDPVKIAKMHADFGYSASYSPEPVHDSSYIRSYREAFAAEDIVIAEIGIWKNLLAPEDDLRQANFNFACERLAFADELGVRCCVSWVGSLAPGVKRGPHPDNLSQRGFDLTVEAVRKLIDAVKPKRCKFGLETMQFLLPDSAEVYRELVLAVDRKSFGVHLDPVNLILSPRMYFNNGALLRHCFELLGPWVVSCHAKDIILHDQNALHLDETVPGRGNLDYATYLTEISKLPGDTPLMMEHLKPEEYACSRDHIVSVARRHGIPLRQAGIATSSIC